MPKITRDNGLVTMEGNPALQPNNVRESESGEQLSAGTAYSTSLESQQQSEGQSSPDQELPVPTTGSPYPQDQTTYDTADSAVIETSEQEETKPRRRRSGY